MSRKDVIKGYESVTNQYFNMLNEIKDFEEEYKNNFISQEQLEQAEKLLEELKDNYDRWSYIIFLLNQPNKKDKIERYNKENKSLVKYFNSNKADLNGALDEGRESLSKLRQYLKELKNNDES